MQPHEYPHRILLCVSGLSPQIITETLYALTQTQEPPFLPTEVHLITTTEGAERARLTLLSAEPGWFRRLLREYALPPIRFEQDCIHLLRDTTDQPLSDIRTPEDNEAAADTIIETVRRLTADGDSALHASIAGGCKTMGFYLGYALSLFGRPQDRLSHVLVSSPFESNQGFYYPSREPRVIYTPPPEQRPLDTREAQVTLAEIPFVRLRDGLDPSLLQGQIRYSETVRRAQLSLTAPELVLDLERHRLRCSGQEVHLALADLAWLAWFARRARQGLPAIHWTEADSAAFLAVYRELRGECSADYARAEDALRGGMTKEYFEQRNSRLKVALTRQLGPAARSYLVSGDGRRPRSRYALRLEAHQVRFEPIPAEE